MRYLKPSKEKLDRIDREQKNIDASLSKRLKKHMNMGKEWVIYREINIRKFNYVWIYKDNDPSPFKETNY